MDSYEPDLDRLVARWRGPLVGLFLARGVGRATSHDLAEDVFVEAWLALREGRFRGDLEDQGAFGPWLRGIARNLAAAHFRRARREPRAAKRGELAGLASADSSIEGSGMDLRRAIDRLPRTLREVILVRYMDEKTGAEAAALLGLTEKAVERRAARARALLREQLAATTAKETP